MQDLLEACSNAFEPNRDRDYERERLYPMLTAPQLRLVLRAREAEIELLRKVIEELNNAFAREFKKKLSTCLSSEMPLPRLLRPVKPPRLVYSPLPRRQHCQREETKEEEEEEAGEEDDWTDI